MCPRTGCATHPPPSIRSILTKAIDGPILVRRRNRTNRPLHWGIIAPPFSPDPDAPSPVRLSTAVSCTCWWNSAFPPAFPISGSVQVTPRFPPAGPNGHGSPPSAVLSERYDFLPSHVLRLIDFASRLRRRLPGFVFAGALPPPCRPDDGRGLDCSRWPSPFQRSCPRARAGSPRFPGGPSRDFAPVHDPGRPVAPRQ